LAVPGIKPNGVELVQAEVRKHSGEWWSVLDIARFFTGRLAPFRFNSALFGMKPPEAKRGCSAGIKPNGVELVQAEVRKHSGE
jgi:hypothetical protein